MSNSQRGPGLGLTSFSEEIDMDHVRGHELNDDPRTSVDDPQ